MTTTILHLAKQALDNGDYGHLAQLRDVYYHRCGIAGVPLTEATRIWNESL